MQECLALIPWCPWGILAVALLCTSGLSRTRFLVGVQKSAPQTVGERATTQDARNDSLRHQARA